MSTTEVWNILARFEVDGEETLLDFETDEVEACKLVAYYQLAHGPYAVIRKQKVREGKI